MEAGNKKEGDNVLNQRFPREKVNFPPLRPRESSTKEVTIAQEVEKFRQSYVACQLHINYLEKSLEKAECLKIETFHKYEKQIRSSNEKADEIMMQSNRENKELCVQIDTKQTKIEAMSKNNQRQESEIKQYRKEISALTENLEDTKRALAEVTAEHNDCSNLALKFETMRHKSDKLEKQIGDLTETIKNTEDMWKNEMDKERELVKKERETDRKIREAEIKEREAERKEREAERKEREAERNSLLEYRKQREEMEQRRHNEIQEGIDAILRGQGDSNSRSLEATKKEKHTTAHQKKKATVSHPKNQTRPVSPSWKYTGSYKPTKAKFLSGKSK